MQYLLHAVGRVIPEARIAQLDIRQQLRIHRRLATDAARQVWANPLAAGRHQRRGLSQLQWRGLHVTLTDAKNDRLAGIPGLAITRPLPVTRRHQPGGFLVHVSDTRWPRPKRVM